MAKTTKQVRAGMTFEQVLDHPVGRPLIEQAEEMVSQLRDRTGDRILGDCLRYVVQELDRLFGYKYAVDADILRNN